MDSRHQMQEDLLYAWMEMSLQIRGNRLLSGFSFNEMMIYGLLHRRKAAGMPPMTATELGRYTNLLKSQINHILTGMERRGLIRRERATHDKRVIYVHPLEEALPRYQAQHEHVLQIVGDVSSALGEEDTIALTTLMRKATSIVSARTTKEDS